MAILRRDHWGLYVSRCNDAFTQLAGYTEEELSRLKLEAIFREWSESALTEKMTFYTLRTKQHQKVPVKLACRTNGTSSEPTWICTATDESAERWIQDQMQRQTVLLSGIVNANHAFEQAVKPFLTPYWAKMPRE
ncbi:hypothetical protein BCM02_101458 [Paenibacillus methanolicus]|uniref:PAS domain S-box-containing protein n=1 Tax=Paenibacillus methanolicus TaxID=582686 RepID=A0A5S5CHV4_9BACL|nr:hypothetical protein BCM02_101458 [Paenibacillus methanolicus]